MLFFSDNIVKSILSCWPNNFGPSFTPKEMLWLGVFEGRYIGAIRGRYSPPRSWYNFRTVLSGRSRKEYPPDPTLNYYGVKFRQSLSIWRENGWLTEMSPNGWFEWYIKFYLGRRITDKQIIEGAYLYEDIWQIYRWHSYVSSDMKQLASACNIRDKSHHRKQRQGLLQWGWDSLHHNYNSDRVRLNAVRIAKKLDLELVSHDEFLYILEDDF